MNRLDCAFAHMLANENINRCGCSYKYLSKTRVNLTISSKEYGMMVYENISTRKAQKLCESAMNF